MNQKIMLVIMHKQRKNLRKCKVNKLLVNQKSKRIKDYLVNKIFCNKNYSGGLKKGFLASNK